MDFDTQIKYQEFVSQHGGTLERMGSNRWVLADGATVKNDGYGPSWYGPPADPIKRHELRKQFCEIRLKRAERDFRIYKALLLGQQCEGHTSFDWNEKDHGPYPGDGLLALKRLKHNVLNRRIALFAVRSEYDRLPEVVRQRQQEEADRRRDQELRELEAARRNMIESIAI